MDATNNAGIACSSTESNLYAISPETSHVSKEFADGDPAFWSPKAATGAKNPANAEAKEASVRSREETKQKQ